MILGFTARSNRSSLILWTAIAALLMLPLVAMQFTPQVAWTGHDFLAAGLLLVTGGAAYEMLMRHTTGTVRVTGIAVAAMLVLLVWAQGAVGIL